MIELLWNSMPPMWTVATVVSAMVGIIGGAALFVITLSKGLDEEYVLSAIALVCTVPWAIGAYTVTNALNTICCVAPQVLEKIPCK